MTPERWQEIKRLYEAALELEASERLTFLNQVCSADDALRREVESLLARQEEAEHFLDAPALEIAAATFVADPLSFHSGQLVADRFRRVDSGCSRRIAWA